MHRGLLAVLLLWAVMLGLSACGGGADADRKELDRIHRDADFTYQDDERETLIADALAIAKTRAGEPIGDEAMTVAQEIVLAYEGDLYAARIPEPAADVEDEYLAEFRNLAGFLEVVPPPYDATAVRERLHDRLTDRAESYLSRLERTLDSRRAWVAEIQASGTTTSWTNHGFDQDAKSMAYLRDLAAGAGEPAEFVAGLDLVTNALLIADWAPPTLDVRYENGTFTNTYSPEAVAGAVQKNEDLAAAIGAARQAVPLPAE
ncbi:MAG TPA: hypothetical protein VFY90_14235 [Tepidiformaceae bacterium]|nr:hypothetical protein [Tepidiformaceae bacterium]